MFSLGMLMALATLGGLAGYGIAKSNSNKGNSNNNAQQQAVQNMAKQSEDSVAKNVNTYNYYTNDSESGNTLFGSQKKTKRTLFGQ